MTGSEADAFRQRVRGDLRVAMKEGRKSETKVLRALLSAIDQAEALPVETGPYVQHDFGSGSAEAARRDLDGAALRSVVEREIDEREEARAEFVRLGMTERAGAMGEEAGVLARYLG